MNTLSSPIAQVELERYPHQPNAPLQAFDAADEYLLHHWHEHSFPAGQRVLILNDSFGALAVSLARCATVTSSGDSYLARLALENNLRRNGLPLDNVTFIPSSEPLTGCYDQVLIRLPKTLSLLEQQLIDLHGHLTAGTQVMAGAMVKYLNRSASELLERYIGPVQASLARKKARLLFAVPTEKPCFTSPYPTAYSLSDPPITLINHANVFCRHELDIGTRVLLPHLPQRLGAARVADLGCGNGVLAIVSALRNPDAHYTLVDESYLAVRSAQENWQAIFGHRPADIRCTDGLEDLSAASLDLVLCNPPFHQQQAIGDFLAWRMFRQAHRALDKNGLLLIVGNRHLGYHVKLKRLFTQVDQIAATPKFVVLGARK